ncbi:hypothetical protein KP79_PYT09444 [Mizuhopecten yessoensis]|uniref:Uncharacterized protein n=1 Tax=Mizuhopecten yessoensis TaxID=6573 RepID=A0A210QNU4_MIZYE|nr:hypothetical protein KP79_PYT09444 [Mizuhopecten yessoensis]
MEEIMNVLILDELADDSVDLASFTDASAAVIQSSYSRAINTSFYDVTIGSRHARFPVVIVTVASDEGSYRLTKTCEGDILFWFQKITFKLGIGYFISEESTMDDEQLRNIAQILVKDVIEKAVDRVKTENRQMDEGLDQGVDGIVGLTIGRSITAIREGQRSPTDNKMERMFGLNKTLVTATPEVTSGTTGSKPLEIKDDRIKPSVGGNDNKPHIITSHPVKDVKLTGLKIGHEATTDAQMTNATQKKNVLERLLDRILKRNKKEAKEMNTATAGGSTSTSVGGKKKSASKAHNKRDWIRRNLLCCFVRQTATVEPVFD